MVWFKKMKLSKEAQEKLFEAEAQTYFERALILVKERGIRNAERDYGK